jgi:hypothetical protein
MNFLNRLFNRNGSKRSEAYLAEDKARDERLSQGRQGNAPASSSDEQRDVNAPINP